jgi:hypothetical protein
MADNTQNPGAVTNTFSKGMVKDYNETFLGEGLWTHARNAVNNSHDGQIGVIGNEPANLKCLDLPYTLVGCIHIYDDQWAIYTTDDIHSEIGIFDESACSYKMVVNDQCLNFKRSHLITGISRRRYDCERIVYWDDGLNPTRVMDLYAPPFVMVESVNAEGCRISTSTGKLDCEKIRIASLVKHPCVNLKKGKSAGTLPNGSYQVCLAYTINQVKVTDYLGLTEVQSLFYHDNVRSSLEVNITSIDANFDEFELVLLAQINGETIARRVGYYSTHQGTIYLDNLSNEFPTIPIASVVFRSEPIEKSDAIYQVNNYALRVGSYSKTKINYQSQANKIKTKWVAVKYPADYYVKGGHNTGYMRDEQYAFFIRWVYNTGEFSESYHIPGRAANVTDTQAIFDNDAYELNSGVSVKRWQVQNTATITSTTNTTLADGGQVIASGEMGYWESTEKYPDNKPLIWDTLCANNIRHHKFPDESCDTSGGSRVLDTFSDDGKSIVMLGVQFENITHPLDSKGNPIYSVIGYEILRGSRQGNKTIIGKGMFNNLRTYAIPNNSSIQGLYQNYPYNDLRDDSYLTSDYQSGTAGSPDPKSSKLSGYKKNVFSFHSPDTTFSNPFVNASEIKIYQELSGTASGKFVRPHRHPKLKIPTNFTDVLTSILGIIKTVADIVGALAGADAIVNFQGTNDIPFTQSLVTPHRQDQVAGNLVLVGLASGYGSIGPTGVPGADVVAASKRQVANTAITIANIATLAAIATVRADITSEQFFKLITAIIPYKDYAAQYVSHAFYNKSKNVTAGSRRRQIINSSYINSDLHSFSGKYQVNNVNRGRFVAVEIPEDKYLDIPTTQDTSRFLMSEARVEYDTDVTSTVSGYYGALKIPLEAQYGQLESIKQLPISTCITPSEAVANKKSTSQIMFGGDTYINRFTEKNTMLFFNTWMYGEPNGSELDYTMYFSLPYARFWINNLNLSGGLFKLASDFRVLDYRDSGTISFHVKRGFFYLFNSGVRDFFVESEINLAYRDYEDVPAKRFYDPYGGFSDLPSLFRSDIVKEPNFYKYDYSLSISKLFNSQISWGNMLSRDYDPAKAETCFSYYPNRVIYSLPQQDESKKDSWRMFLVNNYKDFTAPVTSIKSVNKTGALFIMAQQSPLQFMGVEEIKLDATGAKITIGDGALFTGAQQLQSIVNSDASYEYGSCKNKYSVINCTHGVFWVSQDQGKVFQYANGFNEISRNGMKFWFAKYLPSELLKVFSEYPLFDNPVKGVGVQMIYDNTNEILYITKTDYKPKITGLIYDAEGQFYRIINGIKTPVSLKDPTIFENASWTISYDPKAQTWISFHDWIPTFLLPSKTHFLSVNDSSIWKHNVRCDLYSNFYGKDYPFEVEFVSATGQQVNTMRNIEYLLEAYKTYNNCADKFHILDQNFDQAVVYNAEQMSGLLKLELKTKVNPVALLSYPRIGADAITINYSKEENKYRFNQFWDVTKDRGEFSSASTPMFVTKANGYEYDVNPLYVNYNKSALQRKKFRHNVNRVFLRKTKSNDVKIVFKLSNQKLQPSFR